MAIGSCSLLDGRNTSFQSERQQVSQQLPLFQEFHFGIRRLIRSLHARTVHSYGQAPDDFGRQAGRTPEYLHFTAVAGDDTQRWWSVNTGTLSEDFLAIFGDWGTGILERLRKGETVKLPRPLEIEDARRIGGAGND